jgi:hypothetical protein
MENKLNSTRMERMVVSTYGSFIADSLADWSQQVRWPHPKKKLFQSVKSI